MSRCYSPFRAPSLWFIRLEQAREREVAERQAWLAGVQKRLGLLTRENVNEMIGARLEALGGVMWPR